MSIVSYLDGYPGAGTDKIALKTTPANVNGQLTLNYVNCYGLLITCTYAPLNLEYHSISHMQMIESIPNTTQLLMNETVPHQQSTLNGALPYTVHYSRDELLSLANVSIPP